MASLALVDTNILVYRHDARFPEKQRVAEATLREGLAADTIRLPYQAIIEFVATVTRPQKSGQPLLTPAQAVRVAEELIDQFDVLYPTEEVVLTALRGMATYEMSWYDANLWAFADHYQLGELLSEDFEHGRRYGTVRAVNPFLHLGG